LGSSTPSSAAIFSRYRAGLAKPGGGDIKIPSGEEKSYAKVSVLAASTIALMVAIFVAGQARRDESFASRDHSASDG